VAKKFKIVKVSRQVGDATKAVGPSMTLREANEFAKYGAELLEVAESDKAGLAAALKEADILLYGSVQITREMMEAAPKLIAVLFQTVGYDQIDLKAATENNILVVNNPSFEWCVEEVSNHALTLLLALAKKVKILDKLVSQGNWSEAKKAQKPMGSIYGQTLGIVGCGAIGRMVARKANCFGLKVIGYDPYIAQVYLAKENGITLVNLPELLKESDYVSLHPDLNETSLHMINDKAFAQMKPSAYLINTSRGKVIDEAALVKVLQEGKIAGAGLDVFENEPLSKDSPLTKMDNVVLLSHSASYSTYAFEVAPVSIAKEAGRIFSGKWPLNPVNKEVKPKVALVKGN
jgi:D-3-phosphoglycerate dehydrogenase / 2-oxoglutarate reductase